VSPAAARGLKVAAVAAVLLATAFLVRSLVRPAPADAPVPVPWDQAPCEGCRMLVGEPAFAVQVHLEDGRVLFFDDPGEALLWLADPPSPVHAAWFHALHGDGWIARDAVGFVSAAPTPTPMGYGLGAVEAGTPGALTPAQALERARRVEREREAAP